ncbi:hypothetical protein G6F57_016178 [Rhizopus arrhizus]|nr:hypothetical protein G6F57_016178 [Rhizopus arrhizus]
MGHNDRIAFGLTIFAFGDEEDLYVYDTNPANPGEYRYQGGWEKMRQVDESIPVRGATPAVRNLKFTRHGPVIHEDLVRHKAYALRAAYLEYPGTAAYLASLRLNQAQNWNEFVAGMEKHYTPSENMVYADVDGNIGWFGGSIAPIRPRGDWSGMLPVPGNGDFEWRGILPGSALPRAFNPPEGYVATANEYNLPADYAYKEMPDGAAIPGPAVRQSVDSRAHAAGLCQVSERRRPRSERRPGPAQGLGRPDGHRAASRLGLRVLAARSRQARDGSLRAGKRARRFWRTLHPQDAGKAGYPRCRIRPSAGARAGRAAAAGAG